MGETTNMLIGVQWAWFAVWFAVWSVAATIAAQRRAAWLPVHPPSWRAIVALLLWSLTLVCVGAVRLRMDPSWLDAYWPTGASHWSVVATRVPLAIMLPIVTIVAIVRARREPE